MRSDRRTVPTNRKAIEHAGWHMRTRCWTRELKYSEQYQPIIEQLCRDANCQCRWSTSRSEKGVTTGRIDTHGPSPFVPIEFRSFVFARKITLDKSVWSITHHARMRLILCVFALYQTFVVYPRDGPSDKSTRRFRAHTSIEIMNITIYRLDQN